MTLQEEVKKLIDDNPGINSRDLFEKSTAKYKEDIWGALKKLLKKHQIYSVDDFTHWKRKKFYSYG